MSHHVCFVALGSNLGESCEQLKRAVLALGELQDTVILSCSSLYRSAPVGFLDQPDFMNAVVKISTRLMPQALLAALLLVENQWGRERTFVNSPRTLDLDILLYDDIQVQEPNLTIPHPRMHQRAFVLLPLLEIAPDCFIPEIGLACHAMQACRNQVLTRLITPQLISL